MKKDCKDASLEALFVGEMIFIKEMGHVIVEEIFHTAHDNFVKVQHQETILENLSCIHPYEIRTNLV